MSGHATSNELIELEKTTTSAQHANLTIIYSMDNAKINELVDFLKIITQIYEMNAMSIEVYEMMILIYNVRHVARGISNMKTHDW